MKRRCATLVHGKMVRRRSAGDQQGDSLVLHQTYGVEETFSGFFFETPETGRPATLLPSEGLCLCSIARLIAFVETMEHMLFQHSLALR